MKGAESIPSAGAAAPLLEVRDLSVAFESATGSVEVVRRVSFSLKAGETLAIVGESGCGKTMTALSLLRLVPASARISGEVRFEGRDLFVLSKRALRALRGDRIAMIFQEALTALNPVFRIGEQIAEAVRAHRDVARAAARARALEVLEQVGIPDPKECFRAFPHQLSGGMRQRVLIAAAIACDPIVLVADEPTTALDVTVQAQILGLLESLKSRLGMGLVLLTHDLGVVAESADRVLVLYAGEVVEERDVFGLFESPRHPYTCALLRSRPHGVRRGERLRAIRGVVPAPEDRPSGCCFRTRCEFADERCARERPRLRAWGEEGTGDLGGGRVACHYPERVALQAHPCDSPAADRKR